MGRAVFYVTLPIRIKKKGRFYVSACPSLDVVSQGETEEEARKNIAEAVQLFLEACFEIGTLDDVLKDCGFKVAQGRAIRATESTGNITVPIPLVVRKDSARQCRV